MSLRVKALIFPASSGLVPVLSVYTGRHPDLQVGAGEDFLPDKYEVQVEDEEGTTTEVRERDLSGMTDATHNIDLSDPANPSPIAKDPMPSTIDKTTALVGEDVTISGLPNGEVWGKVEGGGTGNRIAPFTDGSLVLSFDSTDTYTVTLRHSLYLEQIWSVTIS